MKVRANRISVVIMLFAIVLLSACQRRIAVDPSFWTNKEARVGVAIQKYPQAAAFKEGGQGLLDMAINAAMAVELRDHLLTLKLNDFDTVQERFLAELQKRGLQPKTITIPVDIETFAKFEAPAESNSDNPSDAKANSPTEPKVDNSTDTKTANPPKPTVSFFEKDLRSLQEKESVDFLILLSVDGFGTIRRYYGFIPLGAPKGYSRMSGRLIDLRSNQLMWRRITEFAVPSADSWDEPPSYPNLTAAVKKAVPASQELLMKDFFGKGPVAEEPQAAQADQKMQSELK